MCFPSVGYKKRQQPLYAAVGLGVGFFSQVSRSMYPPLNGSFLLSKFFAWCIRQLLSRANLQVIARNPPTLPPAAAAAAATNSNSIHINHSYNSNLGHVTTTINFNATATTTAAAVTSKTIPSTLQQLKPFTSNHNHHNNHVHNATTTATHDRFGVYLLCTPFCSLASRYRRAWQGAHLCALASGTSRTCLSFRPARSRS